MTADVPEMKEMEIETAGAGCSASRQLSADPAAAMKFLEIETYGASGSGKAMEMGVADDGHSTKLENSLYDSKRETARMVPIITPNP